MWLFHEYKYDEELNGIKNKEKGNTQYELRSSYPQCIWTCGGLHYRIWIPLADFGLWILYVSFTLTKSRRSGGDKRFQLAIF